MKPNLDCVVVGYGELALKGGNRGNFENQLKKNIALRLDADEIPYSRIYRVSGRLIVDSVKPIEGAKAIARVFGATSASPAVKTKPSLSELNEAALFLFKKFKPVPESFRVSSRRLEKKIGYDSNQLNEKIGQRIVDESGCRVSLKNHVVDVGVEVGGREAYVHTQTLEGVCGLPVGVAGKSVVLFSGGIDSPVAAYLTMKRGCEIMLLHLAHADSVKKPPRKIERIREKLMSYHPSIPLVCVPAGAIERELVLKVPAKYRIIVLRRVLLRIAEALAKKEGALALSSGDNLGQVASQTLANLDVIDRAIGMLCMRPLIGFDKKEIVDLAKQIGTFEDSILPHTDCCSFLLPKHPSTAAKSREIEEAEAGVDNAIINKALGGAIFF